MANIEWPVERPQFDVWIHLQSGLDAADNELDCLDEPLRKFTEAVARAVLENRGRVVLGSKERGWVTLDEDLLAEHWIRFAADLAIAEEGIDRATEGFKRYVEIRPAVAVQALPDRAQRYIKELAHTYVFGFDPACIALCRAALEQLLKDRLVAIGQYTEPQLRREKPGARILLEKAKQEGLITTAYAAARRVIERGDELMHSHIADEKILRRVAADSIAHFKAAAVELCGGEPTFE